MKQIWVLLFFIIACRFDLRSQVFTVSQAHSHNDYEQKLPFWLAYHAGFGSIEADIFLLDDGRLHVAHDSTELTRQMMLETAYLKPLLSCLKKNKGFPYPDTSKKLQMLIDVKTDAIQTLSALMALLDKYAILRSSPGISWVITGNRPDPLFFERYPSYISFDGELFKKYRPESLKRIAMLSDDFQNYSHWDGKAPISAEEDSILFVASSKAHFLNKKLRFWDAPDTEMAWKYFIRLKVGFINTDHIEALSRFLQKPVASQK